MAAFGLKRPPSITCGYRSEGPAIVHTLVWKDNELVGKAFRNARGIMQISERTGSGALSTIPPLTSIQPIVSSDGIFEINSAKFLQRLSPADISTSNLSCHLAPYDQDEFSGRTENAVSVSPTTV